MGKPLPNPDLFDLNRPNSKLNAAAHNLFSIVWKWLENHLDHVVLDSGSRYIHYSDGWCCRKIISSRSNQFLILIGSFWWYLMWHSIMVTRVCKEKSHLAFYYRIWIEKKMTHHIKMVAERVPGISQKMSPRQVE